MKKTAAQHVKDKTKPCAQCQRSIRWQDAVCYDCAAKRRRRAA